MARTPIDPVEALKQSLLRLALRSGANMFQTARDTVGPENMDRLTGGFGRALDFVAPETEPQYETKRWEVPYKTPEELSDNPIVKQFLEMAGLGGSDGRLSGGGATGGEGGLTVATTPQSVLDDRQMRETNIRDQMAANALSSAASYWTTLAMQTGNPRHIAAADAAQQQYNQYLAIQAEKERFGRGGFAGGEFFAQTGG